MSKLNRIYKKLDILSDEKENNLVKNLLKKPIKDNKDNMPHFHYEEPFFNQQADLLFLPDDRNYKYCLVVIDIATRKCDAEPLKNKTANDVKNAFIKIYKRKILKFPGIMDLDQGTEFKGVCKTYFENNNCSVKYAEPYRSRQLAVVEGLNSLISKIIQNKQLVEEINNNEISRTWVDVLPKIIKLINEEYTQKPVIFTGSTPERGDGDSLKLLDVGTKVRVQLDKPQEFISGKRLTGSKFRIGDIRWNPVVQEITQIYLRPGFCPMYQVDNNTNVAYTKNQLQVVKEDEVKPSTKGQTKFIIDKILEKIKKKGKIFYKVLWNDKSETIEPRSLLLEDVPDLINDFDKK